MSALAITFAFCIGATLPVGLVGWIVGRLSDRLKAPNLRAAVWSAVLAMTLIAGVLPAGLKQRPAPVVGAAPALQSVAPTASTTVILRPAPPTWMANSAEAVTGIVIVGALLSFCLLALRLYRNRTWVRAAGAVNNPALLASVEQSALHLGVRPPRVLLHDGVKSAMLIGFRRPIIVLPAALVAALTPADVGWVCAHELAHLKRMDNARVLTDRVLAAALWFNPFIQNMLGRLAAVREEQCDALVLAGAQAGDRRLYAATLVQALRLSGGAFPQPTFIHRKGAGHLMRLKAILNPAPKPSAMAIALAVGGVGIAAVLGLFVSSAVAQTAQDMAAAVAKPESGSGAPTAHALTYQMEIKLFDRSTLLGAPKLLLREGASAMVESSDPGYRVRASIAPLDADHDALEVHATIKGKGVSSDVAWPRMTIKRGGIAAMTIPGKASIVLSPVTERASNGTVVPGSNIWGSDITADKVTRNAQVDVYEGRPTVRLEGAPPGGITIDHKPASMAEINAIPDGQIRRIELHHRPSEGADAHRSPPLKSIDVITVRDDGQLAPSEQDTGKPEGTTQINGSPATLADARAIPSSKLDHVMVEFAPQREALDGKPHIKAANFITKP